MKILNKIFNGNNSPSLIEGVANMTIQGGHKFASAILSFLFIPVLFITFVATTAFADEPTSTSGYVCDPSQKTYISCNTGYVLSGTGPGNACIPMASCGAGYYKENDSCKSCSEETQGQYPLSRADDNEGKNKCYQTCNTRDIYHPEELPVDCYSETWCKKTDDNKYYVWQNNTCAKCASGYYYEIDNNVEKCTQCPSSHSNATNSGNYSAQGINSCFKNCDLGLSNIIADNQKVYYPNICTYVQSCFITSSNEMPHIENDGTFNQNRLSCDQCSDGTIYYYDSNDTLTKLDTTVTGNKPFRFMTHFDEGLNINSITVTKMNTDDTITVSIKPLKCANISDWTLKLKESNDGNEYFSKNCNGATCDVVDGGNANPGKYIADFDANSDNQNKPYGSYSLNTHIYTLNTNNTTVINTLASNDKTITDIQPLSDCLTGNYCAKLIMTKCPLKATTEDTGKSSLRDCQYWSSPLTLKDDTNSTSQISTNGNALFQMSPTMIESILCAEHACD